MEVPSLSGLVLELHRLSLVRCCICRAQSRQAQIHVKYEWLELEHWNNSMNWQFLYIMHVIEWALQRDKQEHYTYDSPNVIASSLHKHLWDSRTNVSEQIGRRRRRIRGQCLQTHATYRCGRQFLWLPNRTILHISCIWKWQEAYEKLC